MADFRKLKEKTVWDAYPLPDITEILDKLGHYKYFTCLDIVLGYHQIELAPGEGQKLPSAPSRATGITEGYRPATFQKNDEFGSSGLTGKPFFFFFVYLDDIVIYARSLAGHNTKLREVLDRLRTYRLKFHPDKCFSERRYTIWTTK